MNFSRHVAVHDTERMTSLVLNRNLSVKAIRDGKIHKSNIS